MAAHVLDVHGRQLSVKGLLDTGAVVSVLPVSTLTDMGFDRQTSDWQLPIREQSM